MRRLQTRIVADISKYTENFFLGMSPRQTVFGILGGACACFGAFFPGAVQIPFMMLGVCLIMIGFYRPDGIPLEKFIQAWWESHFTNPIQRYYEQNAVAYEFLFEGKIGGRVCFRPEDYLNEKEKELPEIEHPPAAEEQTEVLSKLDSAATVTSESRETDHRVAQRETLRVEPAAMNGLPDRQKERTYTTDRKEKQMPRKADSIQQKVPRTGSSSGQAKQSQRMERISRTVRSSTRKAKLPSQAQREAALAGLLGSTAEDVSAKTANKAEQKDKPVDNCQKKPSSRKAAASRKTAKAAKQAAPDSRKADAVGGQPKEIASKVLPATVAPEPEPARKAGKASSRQTVAVPKAGGSVSRKPAAKSAKTEPVKSAKGATAPEKSAQKAPSGPAASVATEKAASAKSAARPKKSAAANSVRSAWKRQDGSMPKAHWDEIIGG